MRSFVMHKVNEDMEAGRPPSKELIAKIGELIGGVAQTGKFLDGAGLQATSKRVRVAFAKGEPTVTRGPLEGRHEPIAGMTTIQVRSMDEAIAWSKRFAEVVPDGETVVGPVVERWDLGMIEKPAGEVPVKAIITHKNGSGIEREPSAAEKASLVKLHQEMKKSGVFLGAYDLEPSKKGKRLSWKNGKRGVVDGPFAESKELIAGYSLLQTDTLEEVIAFCWPFAEILGDGTEIDVRVEREDG